MKYDLTAIQNLPDTFSLQDLCRVCHISKRDGRYYLQSELIPCTYTGKKTRCYQIRKKDLLKALKDYNERPQRYIVPRKWRESGVLYRKRLQPVIYLPPQDVSSETAKTYYHVDFDEADLRVIVLNIYEPRHPGYQNCITKDQIDWFIETLADTPAGYGVIVVAHCSEKLIEKDNSYPNFYSDNAPSDWTTRFDNITGNPISTIVDAFISGTSITGSYTQEINDTENPSTTVEVTVNYSADFTSKNTGAEFIAYINGHTHYDMIGYLSDTTNTQLSLNITHGAGGQYYNSQDDIPRGNGRGSVQDAFNLYAIDRTAGKVIVCRIGSNKTYDLTDRKIMEIPYK